MTSDDRSATPASVRPRWQRHLWLVAGWLSLVLGFIGIFLPLLPTTPFVLLAAFCFSNGSPRWESWLLAHPRFGPMTRNWREHRAVPLRAKQLATLMMAVSSGLSWWFMTGHWRWVPGTVCLAVAVWLWRLPTAVPGLVRERPDA